MSRRSDDICPLPAELPLGRLQPHAPGIFLASVYRCADPDEAFALLSGDEAGYVYQRDGHPNADMIAEKCCQLHGARWAMMASSGMAALSLATLTYLAAGDHVVVSDQLYGRSLQLLTRELDRYGVRSSLVDTCRLDDVQAVVNEKTRMIVVETISNPMLRVADIAKLAELARGAGAKLLVDNTFASPCVCRPLELGADLVLESLSKMMNGHSDVMLGMLCGQSGDEKRLRDVLSVWGLASSPFDCWLALRGMSTLHLRMQRACDTAAHVAPILQQRDDVTSVLYPNLSTHPDHALAESQFDIGFGSMLTFSIPGGRAAAEQFMKSAGSIEFCPSLGEVSTTVSHPASTSHRGLTPEQQGELGIEEGTLRLSVGTESAEFIVQALLQGLDASK